MTSPAVSSVTALLAMLFASGAHARDFDGWTTDHAFGEHVVGGYVGCLNRPDGKMFSLFQKSGDGTIAGFVGATGCEAQLDVEMPPPASGDRWDATRRKPVQREVSRLLTRIAAACRVARPADHTFFRGFADALADLDSPTHRRTSHVRLPPEAYMVRAGPTACTAAGISAAPTQMREPHALLPTAMFLMHRAMSPGAPPRHDTASARTSIREVPR